MLHVGLDLSRRRVDVCALSDHGELIAQTAAPPTPMGCAAWPNASRVIASRCGR
jgi:hypothetical protein